MIEKRKVLLRLVSLPITARIWGIKREMASMTGKIKFKE